VGLASSAVRREEDRELTFEVGDGVTGSGTAMGALPAVSRPKEGSAMGLVRRVGDGATGSGATTGVGDDDGGIAGGVEAEGRVGNGVGTMARRRGRRRRRGRETWVA
jgi:hypothetical protein